MKCKQASFKDDSGLLSKITSNIKGMIKSGRKFGLEIGMFMNDEIVENIEDIYTNIRDDSGDWLGDRNLQIDLIDLGFPDYDIYIRNTGGYDVFYSLSLLDKAELLQRETETNQRETVCSLLQRLSDSVYGRIEPESQWVKVFSSSSEMCQKLGHRIMEEFTRTTTQRSANDTLSCDNTRRLNLRNQLTEYAKVILGLLFD